MAKSYYAILGIASDANNNEIRSACRRLAKAYHPDHYAGSSQMFRDIQEAYAVLGDQERRLRRRDSPGLFRDPQPATDGPVPPLIRGALLMLRPKTGIIDSKGQRAT